MSIIKIEFPAEDKVAAAAFSTALATIAGDQIVVVPAVQEHTHQDAPQAPTTAVGDQLAVDSEQEQEEEPGKSAEPAATETTQTTGIAEAAASAGNDAPRDTKGVPFDSHFCGQAKEPYYGSGKRAGQWKKRKGVDDGAYDAWYADELAKIDEFSDEEEQPVNTAGAFAPAPAAGSATPPPPAASDAPKDTGSFMGWVSEKQAAGALTQDQVNAAWAEAGVEMADLFNKAPEEVAANIKKVYDVLAAKVGA